MTECRCSSANCWGTSHPKKLHESVCTDCGGTQYASPPKEMLVDAILREF